MQLLKQSTAATLTIGPILDSAGAEYTGAVIADISISKNGTVTALAAAATLTHVANGWYTLELTTGNTDTLGRCNFHCNKSTYQMPPFRFTVMAAAAFDVLVTNGAIASPTNITAGTLTTVTNLTNLPAITAGWLTAAGIAADAITAAAIADGAIDAATFAADAITAAAIAADAIGSDELAASAITEIQSGLATAAALTIVDDFLDTEIAAIKAQTDLIPAAPASTTNITAGTITTATNVTTVNGLAAGVITAASIATGAVDADALATDAGTEIAAAVWDQSLIPYLTGSNMGNSVYLAGTSPNATDIRDAVWAKTLTELSAVPGITADTLSALNWLFTLHRNKRTETSATETLFKDDGSTALATSAKADDGTTFTAGEYA